MAFTFSQTKIARITWVIMNPSPMKGTVMTLEALCTLRDKMLMSDDFSQTEKIHMNILLQAQIDAANN